jgi:hypothetical protein
MQGHDRRDTHCTINLLNNKYSISVFSQQLRGCKLKQIKTTITSGWWWWKLSRQKFNVRGVTYRLSTIYNCKKIFAHNFNNNTNENS